MKDTYMFDFGDIKIPATIDDIFTQNFDSSYTCYYRKDASSLLNQLCDQYGSDKGETRGDGHPYAWASHTYADFIERHFGHCRGYIQTVFECGLGTNNPSLPSSMGAHGRPGASLRVWRDYFPKAEIVGADVDRDILFAEERIRTFYCDQTDPAAIAALWAELEGVAFDLMIDDGLHTFEAGRTLLEHSFHRLRPGGVYIIEDVAVPTLFQFKQYLMSTTFRYDFVNLHRKGLQLGDNSLIVIRK